MEKYREILRLYEQGLSGRSIAACCGCSRNTVAKVLERAQELDIGQSDGMSEAELESALFGDRGQSGQYRPPDYEYIHREMAKSGVTLRLLWNEYCEGCRLAEETPYMYTQFCLHYRDWAGRTKATMHIHHKPGEKMEVDWAGQKMSLRNNVDGSDIPVSIFVAVLPCSGYAYVEGFLSQDIESWICAHVNAYRFFGGATRILVPDNLKTGVTKVDWYTPSIHRTYQELAEHYGTAVIPARVRKPKDKPSVEGAVGVVSTWVIAALRRQQFFSLPELNQAVREKLDAFNALPFQKKPGCRREAFEEEREYLLPLPGQPYELAKWKVATVQFNYHVAVQKQYYSVPYEYIKQKVDVRITKNMVEIFYGGNRIASHVCLHGRDGQYSTITDHMPPNHQKFLEWDGDRFRKWARSIGENTGVVVDALLSSYTVEQQGYRACMGLLKLADKYSVARLEAACKRALSYTLNPGFKSIQNILKTGSDKLELESRPDASSEHGFTRGAAYYGRKGE
ncbi:IS21 family transposase [Ruminococcaceae bacterium OttesenSCG-928-A11]|nr:IS21 family transposase [Ruminococcaceae bacterium OttesenSCG-928-A11]